ncbi:zinc finger protein 260-like [Uranotaenia lowii]|uniref:zinc finger protein 260-like n=1 Tax=Uranotaenia lowii TaxID=190385 RepID=UPI00247879E1|nr:zinc finger protein 260-like [Uranotaenia lowii]
MDSRNVKNRYDKLCRFCISENDCIPIFTGDYVLNSQLSKCVDVLLTKVDADDGLPNNICSTCLACIEQFVDFETVCSRSYEILERIRTENLTENQHLQTDLAVKTTQVQVQFLNVQKLVDDECNESSSSSIKHTVVSKNLVSQDETSPEEPLKIEALEEEAHDDQYSLLMESDEAEELCSTDEVNRNLPTRSRLDSVSSTDLSQMDNALNTDPVGFVDRANRKIPLFECIFCKNTYRGRNTLKKHLRIHFNIKSYKCSHCPKSFTDRSSLRIHEGRHSGRSFECSYCGKSYFSLNEMQQHQTMQHLERKFECETCGRKFPTRTVLNEHFLVHKDLRPFRCDICDATFKRKRNLIRHTSLHVNKGCLKGRLNKNSSAKSPIHAHDDIDSLRTTFCPVCTEWRGEFGDLYDHLNRCHDSEMKKAPTGPRQCQECEDGPFNSLKSYIVHSLVHRPTSNFVCDECDRTFNLDYFASIHALTHGNQNSTFFCDSDVNCRLVFSDKLRFDQHRRDKHAVEM